MAASGLAEVDTSIARVARRMAASVAVADLLAVAATLVLVRDPYVATAAGFSALVALAYLTRLAAGPFDPYGSISLLIWTVVSATFSPGWIVAQGVCMIGMAFVLANSVSPRLANRRYVKFMRKAMDSRN